MPPTTRSSGAKIAPANIRDLFAILRDRLGDTRLRSVKLRLCPLADAEHRRSWRQFMHYNHHKNTICFASASALLDLPWQLGLLSHEFGHALRMADSDHNHTERSANVAANTLFGIKVWFEGPNRLEYAEPPRWLLEALGR